MFLICDVKIIRDTADVNPDETGPETKFMRKPKPKIPIVNSTMPHNKDKSTDFCHDP